VQLSNINMSDSVHYVNMFLGLGVILLQIFSVITLLLLVCGFKKNKYLAFIKNNFLTIGFLVSISAVLVSLYYSEYLHYAPCLHCWIDRIFIFPQVIIFAIALWKKDRGALLYSFALTLLGLINSLYHIYIYYFGEGVAPCDASGVSCVQRLVSEFGGYISIPTMAFSGFFALLVLCLIAYFYEKEV
jgi:disulfide bond formation protein DsbB